MRRRKHMSEPEDEPKGGCMADFPVIPLDEVFPGFVAVDANCPRITPDHVVWKNLDLWLKIEPNKRSLRIRVSNGLGYEVTLEELVLRIPRFFYGSSPTLVGAVRYALLDWNRANKS